VFTGEGEGKKHYSECSLFRVVRRGDIYVSVRLCTWPWGIGWDTLMEGQGLSTIFSLVRTQRICIRSHFSIGQVSKWLLGFITSGVGKLVMRQNERLLNRQYFN
jgi:hypothetical protein